MRHYISSYGLKLVIIFGYFLPRISSLSQSNVAYDFDITQCGSKQGCWFMPTDCQKLDSSNSSHGNVSYSSCDSLISWRLEKQPNGKRNLIVAFNTRTDDIPNKYAGKYAALGFSKDYHMGDDFVIECVANPSGRIKAFVSFNDLTTNIRSKKASRILLSNTQGVYVDDRLICQTTFSIDNITSSDIPPDERWRIIDITSEQFYFLFARGNADTDSDAIQAHNFNDGDLFPWVATDKVDVVNDVKIIGSAKHYDIPRSVQYQLVKAHGIMMIFGWWIFAAIAMFLSRHFKQEWTDKKLCGNVVWFQLHRALMIFALLLICIAFALIFIQKGDIITCSHICDDKAYSLMLHTYLGITCTAGALIQPFMALARPAPTHPKRPIFNWLHWFFGTGSFLIATVTIFLSAVLGKAGLRRMYGYKPDYVMAGYVVAYIVCAIIFEMVWYFRYRDQTTGPIQLSVLSGPKAPISSKASESTRRDKWSKLRTGVLGFFIISAIALCITLAVFIASNHH